MQVTPSIFKAYDIRGVVPTTLDERVAEGLGKAFGTHALKQGQSTVAVGRDGRLSGPALSAALIRGLVAAGIQVIDIGLAKTELRRILKRVGVTALYVTHDQQESFAVASLRRAPHLVPGVGPGCRWCGGHLQAPCVDTGPGLHGFRVVGLSGHVGTGGPQLRHRLPAPV
jgi:hypothetical protein